MVLGPLFLQDRFQRQALAWEYPKRAYFVFGAGRLHIQGIFFHMRRSWTSRLFLLAACTAALAGSGCGRSATAVSTDAAAKSDTPASTGGVSLGSGGSAGGQTSGGTGGTVASAGSTGADGSGGVAIGGAGGAGGAATGDAGGTSSGTRGGTASGGAGGAATGGTGAVKTGGTTTTSGAGGTGPGGPGGLATGGAGGTGPGGSGGVATGGAGGAAAGGSTGSGGTTAKGGSTGGVPGSGGDGGSRTGGTGGAGTADGGGTSGSDAATVGEDTYAGCSYVGGIDRVAVAKTTAQGMCVMLMLRDSKALQPLDLTITSTVTTWSVDTAAMWPASTASCTSSLPPKGASRASSGTGTVAVNGKFGALTIDVDIVLTFGQGDAGPGQSETLQAQAVATNLIQC